MSKSLVIRDPAFDYIHFPAETAEMVRSLLGCREVQRLRRVKQLGFSYATYPGAEHSRFQHCIGAAYAAQRLLRRFEEIGIALTEIQQISFIAAALLHDVGHFPFSHATETALKDTHCSVEHEEKTITIVGGATEVNECLSQRDGELPQRVVRLISGGALDDDEAILHAFIDGNFDVDRLDFIVRDSVHTGVRSGLVDWQRLLDGLVEYESFPMHEQKNLATIEEFLIARYMMYEKVYFHKTTRGMEVVYKAWLKRLWLLYEAGELSEDVADSRVCKFMGGDATDDDFALLDDADIVGVFKDTWCNSQDEVLRDMARRLLWRDPLKAVVDAEHIPGDPDAHDRVRTLLTDKGFPPTYYYHWDGISDLPYKYNVVSDGESGNPGIRILVGGSPEDIIAHSDIARALLRRKTHTRAYAPAQCTEAITQILGTQH